MHHYLYGKNLQNDFDLTLDSYTDTNGSNEDYSELAATHDTGIIQAEHCSLNALAINTNHASEQVDIKSVAARSLMKLKSDHHLCQRALDDIIQMNTEITQSVCKRIKTTLHILQAHKINMDCYEEVQAQMDGQVDIEPFKGIHTAHLQKKYISTNFPYIVSGYIAICIHKV